MFKSISQLLQVHGYYIQYILQLDIGDFMLLFQERRVITSVEGDLDVEEGNDTEQRQRLRARLESYVRRVIGP